MNLHDLPEEPDFLDEDSSIDSLEVAFLDLDQVIEDIERAGGVSKTIIKPALQHLPTEIHPNSFTVNPTKTNLTVTLEALSTKEMLLLGAAILAVGVVLTKLVQYLRQVQNKVANQTKAAAKLSTTLQATVQKNKRIKDLMHGEVLAEYEQLLETAMAARVKSLTDSWNFVLEDVLNDGPITRSLQSTRDYFSTIEKFVLGTVKILKDYANRELVSDELGSAKAVATIEAVSFPTFTSRPREMLKGVHAVHGPEESTLEDMREISAAFRDLLTKPAKTRFVLEDALTKAASIRVGQSTVDKTDLSSELAKIEGPVKSLEKLKPSKNAGHSVEVALRKATTSMRSALEVFRLYVQMSAKAAVIRNQWISDCTATAEAMTRVMAQAIVTKGDDDLKEALRKLNKDS